MSQTAVDRSLELDELRAQVGELGRRVDELHALLRRTQIDLCRRVAALHPAGAPGAGVAPEEQRPPVADGGDTPVARMRADDYRRLVARVKGAVRAATPVGAVVSVISRGDDALLEFEARTGWHFPRIEDGRYAGHHPGGDAEAVAYLEEARRQGAGYLVVPATSRWWLDHYPALRRHLESTGRLVAQHDDSCVIFAIN